MGQIERQSEVQVISSVDTKLDNIEDAIAKQEALVLIRQLEKNIKGYKFFLSVDENKKNMYIIGKSNGKKVLLNIPFKLQINNNDFISTLENIKKLLEYDGEIQLSGGKEWRAISKNLFLRMNDLDDRVVYSKLPGMQEVEFYIQENNKIEELFVFIQILKGIPEQDWIVSKSVKDSGELGNIYRPNIKEEN